MGGPGAGYLVVHPLGARATRDRPDRSAIGPEGNTGIVVYPGNDKEN